ncbi:transcription elongation factor GreAB [Mariniphaga sediminis]|jgi:regulator of nucleoside diphosphate kinase|uniref:Transcription elongation factor GreAB n=1 Tax=Mariniphaga sediminis TaxID=1628158 RepID=A0A399D4X8_9BACT|nr:GreA/GreB family elongation factor [Mariniphaga sediminis]RIH66238.1 transcription elongation factor GreAB [Mariniphaga sediminis]
MENNINITEDDYTRLCNLIKSEKDGHTTEMNNLVYLGSEIKRARRINSKKNLPDFITMNSMVELIDLDTKREMKVRLVYPKDADFKKGNISVLSMLGSALLGYKAGSIISFNAPRGVKKVKIKNIVYPEEKK